MEDRIAKPLMPCLRHLRQALQQRIGFARDQLRQNLGVQALEQIAVPGQIAAVQQRKGELHIILVEAGAVCQSPGRRADTQPDVPHVTDIGRESRP